MSILQLWSDVKNRTSYSVKYLEKNSVQETLSPAGIQIRKILAPLLRRVYLTQTEYKLIVDKREKLPTTTKGRIFIINHRQGDDIVLGANIVNRSAYIVFGNPHLAFETTNGLGLWAYGMILLRRDDALSRKSAYEKMKYVVEHGGNVIIYPEGYWNLNDNGQKDELHLADGHKSDNWLIQDFNIGIFRLAQETGSTIVPVVLHYDEVEVKRCYAYRGHPIKVTQSDDVFDKKNEILTQMQTEYFRLCEKYSFYRRVELEAAGKSLKVQWEELKSSLIEDCNISRIGYYLDLADEKKIGKAKVVYDITTTEEVYESVANIKKITPENVLHVVQAAHIMQVEKTDRVP